MKTQSRSLKANPIFSWNSRSRDSDPQAKHQKQLLKKLARLILPPAIFVLGGSPAWLHAEPVDSWILRSSYTSQWICSVAYGISNYVAVGYSGTILSSPNGATWTSRTSGTSLGLYSISYGNGKFVAVGQIILSSADGVNWTTRDSGSYAFEAVAYINGAFMTVGDNGVMKVSSDGITWSTRNSGTTTTLYALAYGNSTYVVVGSGGTIRTSPDGLNWTPRASGTPQDINGVTFANGLFVAQGNYGVVLTSTDGINWTSRNSGTGAALATTAYGFDRFVMVGMYGTIVTSTNGVDWVGKASGVGNLLIGVCAGPDSFVAVGDTGCIVQSGTFPTNGIWQEPTNRTVSLGQTAQFNVATWWATPPPSYQWRKDGVVLTNGGTIAGATTPLLTISNAVKLNEGAYRVVINSAARWATSQVATLTVVESPSIVVQPTNQMVNRGQDVTLSVVAAGTAPLSYQWRTNAVNLSDGGNVWGVHTPTLTLTNVQLSNAGNYTVVVTNQYGSATSDTALLTVNPVLIDPNFNADANEPVYSMALQADGKILVGGQFGTLNGQHLNAFGRLNVDGSLDTTFHPDSGNTVFSLAVQSDGKILAGGAFTQMGGQPRNYLARINAADGSADSSFNPGADNHVYCLALQSDGKIVAGGYFNNLAGQTRNYIGRLNADGTVDASFNPGANTSVYALAVQADGKILVGGSFTTLGGQPRNYIGRLNADGSLDTTFNPGASGEVYCLAVQADGMILVGGYFTTLGGQARYYIGRLNADGTIDGTFNPGANWKVFSLAVQTDGKILVGGGFTTLAGQVRHCAGRLNANGTIDDTFADPGADTAVISLAVQADGKVLVGGAFTTLGGRWRTNICRINPTDPATQSLTYASHTITWLRGGTSPEVWRTTFDYTINGVDWVNLGDGTRVSGGWQFGTHLPANASVRARGFVAGGYDNASGWLVEAFYGVPIFLTQPLSRTNAFSTTAIFSAVATGTGPLSYRWYKGGNALTDGGNITGAATATLTITNVQKRDEGGYSLMVSNGLGGASSAVAALAVADPGITNQPVSVCTNAGANVTFNVSAVGSLPLSYQWRRNTTDLSDGGNVSGAKTTMLTLTNVQGEDAGNYSVAVSHASGSVTSIVATLTVNLSTLDTGFNAAASDSVCALALLPDGKMLVGGFFNNLDSQPRSLIAKLNYDGSLDSEFNSWSKVITPNIAGDDYSLPGIGGVSSNLNGGGCSPPRLLSHVSSLTVQTDGKFLAGGWFVPPSSLTPAGVARFTSTGTQDSGFTPAATGGDYPYVNCLIVQDDGRILVGGSFTSLAGQSRNGVGRLNANGTLDGGFNPPVGGYVYSLAVQPDGKILVGGNFTTLAGQARCSIGRLNADGTLDNTFNPGVAGSFPYVLCLAVQADGKILVGGTFTALAGQPRIGIGRLNADGSLDDTFNSGAGGIYPFVIGLSVQTDGRILVGGEFTMLAGQTRSGIGRLNADGTLDNTFNPGALPPFVYSLAVQPDAKILATGGFGWLGTEGVGCFGLGRLNNTEVATQNLTRDGSTITWLRGGASPEVWRTTFEYSTNGTDWISLGAGTRITGGWQLVGISAPLDSAIRARGFVTGGECNGSSWFVESTSQPAPQAPPTILVNDGCFGFQTNHFGFNVAGVAGQTIVIEASMNLVNWSPVATNLVTGSPFYFYDPDSTNLPACFYRARLR